MKAIFNDQSLNGYNIQDLGPGVRDNDAVNLQQLRMRGARQSKSISVLYPEGTEAITLFRSNTNITVYGISFVLPNAIVGDSVDFEILKATDRSTVSPTVLGTHVCTSASGQNTTVSYTLDNDEWLWLKLTSKVGEVVEFHLTLHYEVTG
jgi:hypothetical protein